MHIIFDAEHRTFKLDTVNSTYIIEIYKQDHILNLYYGAPIAESYLAGRDTRFANASFSPSDPVLGELGHRFRTDTAPMEYSTNGAGDYRISCLSVRTPAGDSVTDLRYAGHKIYTGKPALAGQPSTYESTPGEAETLELYARDALTGLFVTLYYTVFYESGVMCRRVRAENRGEGTLWLERVLSMCVDLPSMEYDMISLWGRHNHERYTQRVPLGHGLQGVESHRGVSGHCHNPYLALASRGADEDHGEVYAFNLVYSGNFTAMCECDFNCTSRVVMGINPIDFEWQLAPGEAFDTPEAVMVYTDRGIGHSSRIFHRFYNQNLVRGRWKTEKRPLLINSWEAAYFDFDSDKLVSFAKEAADLGIEMLVMDDGWFGRRDRDNCSLGDWYVYEKKLPGGLKPLISRINDLGLKFGIWFEPEMISPDSDLFRAHPDWHVHVEGRTPMIARNQYVLDVSREDVRENIWQQLYDVLANNPIDYVKWDFNRNITEAASALLPPERKKEFFHRFILGTYDLMDRLVTTFPNILFENCSGGGGRFDPAMLAYSPQIWASDNTDPIERLNIQFGTSMCYPASTMGAHVSAKRRTGYVTKGNVALWGTFGYELDPVKLTDEERGIIRSQIAEYHRTYDLIRKGDLYRLLSPETDAHRAAWMFVSPERDEALLTVVTMRMVFRLPFYLKLRGLDADAMYTVEESGETLSGAALMQAGLVLHDMPGNDCDSFTVHLRRI